MSINTHGGGSQTNANGLKFEQDTDLKTALSCIPGYQIEGNIIKFNKDVIGISAPKHQLYKLILEPKGIDFSKFISKKLLPDEALYLPKHKIIYIIEKKFQNGSGSVDEKLQTCEFKKLQYQKLFNPLGIEVIYTYLLCDWFKNSQYTDVLNFIKTKGCYYYFNTIPLSFLNLPS